MFESVGGIDTGTSGARRLRHHREAFVSNVDGVLAMRLSCKEEGSGKGCLRRVLLWGSIALGVSGLGSARRVKKGFLPCLPALALLGA